MQKNVDGTTLPNMKKEASMHLRKLTDRGHLLLQGIPDNLHLIAFGRFHSGMGKCYFAFLAPKDTFAPMGTKFDGMRYAEGIVHQECLEIEQQAIVKTTRHGDGSYTFLVGPQWSCVQSEFFIQPKEQGESTCDEFPIEVIFLKQS